MQGDVFAPGEGLGVPVVVASASTLANATIGDAVAVTFATTGELLGSAAPQKGGRHVWSPEHELPTLLEHEPVEGPDGQDLGVPVVEYVTTRLWELGAGETFHACAVVGSVVSSRVSVYYLFTETLHVGSSCEDGTVYARQS